MGQMFGAAFFIIWALIMIGSVAAFIILVIAIWRAMKAHESVAVSLREIAFNLRKEP